MLKIPYGNDFSLRIPITRKVVQPTGEVEIQSFDPDLVETMNVFLQHNEYVSDWHSTQIEWAADPDNDSSIIAYVQSEMAPIGTYNLIFTGIYDGKRFFTQQRRQFKVTGGILNTSSNNCYPLDSVVFLDTRGRDGLSAYELAVARGFEGSESEWMASLKGETGNGVAGVELVGKIGNVDTYRMVFTNGSYFDFTVTNSSSKLTPEQINEVIAAILEQISAGDLNAYTKEETDALLNNYILSTQKGVANGVATLDASGKLPSNQLPTVDTTPTSNSQNLVTSGGVYQALQNVEIDVDSTLSPTSENPIQNKAVKSALDLKANQATTYSKTEVDTKLSDVAHIGDDDGQAVIPDFDAETDSLWKKAQTLSIDEQDIVSANLFNKASGNGMGRVVLKKNQSFASQVTQANTIYVIKYDYDLNSASVTIPENCVLEFEGGSLSNGTINLSTAKVLGAGIKCTITNPFDETIKLSQCLIDDNISTEAYNTVMLQMLVDNNISIISDVDSVTCSSRITCSGNKPLRINCVNGKHTTFNFPNSDGFVFTETDSGQHNGISAFNYVNGIDINSDGYCFNFKPTDYKGAVFNSIFTNIYATSQNEDCFYCGDNISDFYHDIVFEVTFRDIVIRSYKGYGFNGFSGNQVEFSKIKVYGCQLGAFYNCIGTFNLLTFDQTPSEITGRSAFVIDRDFASSSLKIYNSYFERLKEIILIKNQNFIVPIILQGCTFVYSKDYDEDGVANYCPFTLGRIDAGLYLFGNLFAGDTLTYGDSYAEFKTISNVVTHKVYTDRELDILNYQGAYTYHYFPHRYKAENLINQEFSSLFYDYTNYISSDRIVSKYSLIKPVTITADWSINITDNVGQFYILNVSNDVAGSNTNIRQMTFRFMDTNMINWYLFLNGSSNATVTFVNNVNTTAGRFITPNGQDMILSPGEFVYGILNNKSKRITLFDKQTLSAAGGSVADRPTLTASDFGKKYYNSDTHVIDYWNGTKWVDANGFAAESKKGTTSARPTLTSSDSGFQYYDTDLGKYICWNGTAWVNLDGTALS